MHFVSFLDRTQMHVSRAAGGTSNSKRTIWFLFQPPPERAMLPPPRKLRWHLKAGSATWTATTSQKKYRTKLMTRTGKRLTTATPKWSTTTRTMNRFSGNALDTPFLLSARTYLRYVILFGTNDIDIYMHFLHFLHVLVTFISFSRWFILHIFSTLYEFSPWCLFHLFYVSLTSIICIFSDAVEMQSIPCTAGGSTMYIICCSSHV